MKLHSVILAGGRGERFWPLSRRDRPKQFLRLVGTDSLLEATVGRALSEIPPHQVWIVAGSDLHEPLRQLSLALPEGQFLWESVGRNTAAAIGAAVERILLEEDGEVLIMPSDHWIPDSEAFWTAVRRGRRLLERSSEALVTFGIEAAYAETGYGYVERGRPIESVEGAFEVVRFHEKPRAEQAAEYLKRGGFYWNSGIFLCRASVAAAELRRHVPGMLPALDRLREDLAAGRDSEAWPRYFDAAPSESFDHGVMERTNQAAVVEARFPWSDMGNYAALGALMARDPSGNRSHGTVLSQESENCILLSEPGGLLAVLGVKDLIVVRVGDATLVCPLERAQDVRRLVEQGKIDELLRPFF